MSRVRKERRARGAWLGVVALFLGASGPPRPAEQPDPPLPVSQASNEYSLKGAFLYKFIHYTTWPASSFEDDDSPLVVTLLGEHPGARDVEEVLRGKRVGPRPLELRRAHSPEECVGVHVVYALGEDVPLEQRLIALLQARPVLLLSDRGDFAERGGTLNFYLEEAKIRFAVNPKQAGKAGLKLSSELLKLAKIVGERKK